VALTKAAETAEQNLLIETKAAESKKEAMRHEAEEMVIKAEAERAASEKSADARKILADALAEEEAVLGIGEARALDAKAAATEKFGTAEAVVIQRKAEAEATAIQKQGEAEAIVIHSKASAEAKGIDEKAAAMKKFDAVGKEHEEFKLRLNKELDIELAHINVQKDIAREQAAVIAAALKSARIDIVGGDNTFFDKIVDSVTKGKSFDRMIDNSTALTDIKETLFNGDSANFTDQLKRFTSQFGMNSEELKNISISAALTQMIMKADSSTKGVLETILAQAKKSGIADQMASNYIGK
jgi:flotillin